MTFAIKRLSPTKIQSGVDKDDFFFNSICNEMILHNVTRVKVEKDSVHFSEPLIP